MGGRRDRTSSHHRRAVMGVVWLALAMLGWSATFPERAILQVTIVDPEDVTTPTPTPAAPAVLLPTPTPFAPAAHVDEVSTTYEVRADDTLWSVALETGVDLDDVPCMVGPHFRPEQPLVVGDRLEFLPLGWRCHTVQPGETLGSIAAQVGISVEQIRMVAWNQPGLPGLPLEGAVDGYAPAPGINLRIPRESRAVPSFEGAPLLAGSGAPDGGFLGYMLAQPLDVAPVTAYGVGGPRLQASGPVPKDWPYGSGNFTWPVYGWLSQGYREDHRAIDIAAPPGAFVTAADRGVVIRSGWNDQGYGLFVIIDHKIDYVTLYSHLSDVFVREGEIVGQGQVIGLVGSTGNSTGPHLHFEIRDFGRRTNPLGLLVR